MTSLKPVGVSLFRRLEDVMNGLGDRDLFERERFFDNVTGVHNVRECQTPKHK